MCTVSYIKTQTCTILTSNRDEHILRPNAKAPQHYVHGSKVLYYPKDPAAGGTWFCLDELGSVIVLLNGAQEKHRHLPPYRKSRGLILLDIMQQSDLLTAWDSIDLNRIEPFTLIHYSQVCLWQHRWDGNEKQSKKLDPEQKYIWSSSTLYPKEIREMRQLWFDAFTQIQQMPNAGDLMHFHENTGKHDPHNGILMNRDQKLLTKNITQCIVDPYGAKIIHKDLIENTRSESNISYKIR